MSIQYRFINVEDFWPMFKTHRPILFSENNTIELEFFMSDDEKDKRIKLKDSVRVNYEIYLIAYDNEKIIGWSWGYAKSNHEYYMCNSAVLPEYRGKKVYSSMIDKIIEKVSNDGFQEITSKHHASNNAVLIPKLKKGFLISGNEINAKFGLMVCLTYFPNKKIENIFHQRIGFKK